jgi:hypothetical protein
MPFPSTEPEIHSVESSSRSVCGLPKKPVGFLTDFALRLKTDEFAQPPNTFVPSELRFSWLTPRPLSTYDSALITGPLKINR